MRPPGLRFLGMWASAGALAGMLGLGVVQAQDMKPEAKALRDSQSTALSAGPTTAPTAATVPGYAGDSPDLQAFEKDPDGLKAAGTSTYGAGSPSIGLTNSSLDARNASAIDPTSDWLTNSADVHTDPMTRVNSGGATTTGAEGETCTSEEQTKTTTSHSLYTCETAIELHTERNSCTEHYEPKVESYSYVCDETYNYATHSWQRSAGCDAARGDGACTGGTRTCTAPTSSHTETYECTEGYQERVTTGTGSYDCQEGYSEGGATPASCSAGYNPNIQYGAIAGPCALPTPENGYFDQCGGAWGMPRAGCVMIDESWDAAGGHWATFACDPYDAGGSYDESSCSGMSGCTSTGTVCVEGPATYNFNGASVYRDCWRYQYNYSCPGGRVDAPGCFPPAGSTLSGSSCAATNASGDCTLWDRHYTYTTTTTTRDYFPGCSPPGGASQVRSSCAATDINGACTATTRTYVYEAEDEAGPCAAYTQSYSCVGDVGGRWVPDGPCSSAGAANCKETGTTCTEGPGTRDVGGVNVYAACWARSRAYECLIRTETNNCSVPDGCVHEADTCLEDTPSGPGGECMTIDHSYQCTSTTTTTTTVNNCQRQMCLGDSCFTLEREANDEFPQVYAQLAAMDQAGKDYAGNPDFQIFKGTKLRCKKAVLGFRNCCKDSGWGVSLGLAHCDEQEKQLIAKQEIKATHYVGTYCSNNSLFGCLEKSMVYCAFEGSLGRIVQEAGRPQIGKTWGTAKSPDCSGFTVDQFQMLDLTNVDFSEFYNDKLKDFAPPNADATATRIQDSLSTLYGNGSNPNGPQ